MREGTLTLAIDGDVLRPLVRQIVQEVAEALRDAEAAVPGSRLAYSEAEAARLLGLNQHVLRDERLRGRIEACRVVGGRIRYEPAALRGYLASRRMEKSA